jgi:hypothetical protein
LRRHFFTCGFTAVPAQVKKTQAWVWAGNGCTPYGAGLGVSTVCSGLSRQAAFDTDAASRFMLYLPLWRACDSSPSLLVVGC